MLFNMARSRFGRIGHGGPNKIANNAEVMGRACSACYTLNFSMLRSRKGVAWGSVVESRVRGTTGTRLRG